MARRESTKPHPHAEIFPLHEGQPLWDLSDRIKANGLREPIVTLDDMILDGRRRELACFRAGVEPKYRKFGSRKEDGKDPLEFVIDTNLHRRHLGEGERALAAARYANAQVGQPKKVSSQVATISEKCTNTKAAEVFDVPEAAVDRAKTVLAKGTAELQAAVKDETITVSDAAKVATEPPEVQREAVEAVKSGKAKSAKAAVDKAKEEESPAPVADAVGVAVPEKALPAFAQAVVIGAVCRELDQIVSRVEEIGKQPGGEMMHTTSQVQSLQNVRKSLWGSRATHVCPYCKGVKKTCDACKGAGWTTKAFYNQAPESTRVGK